MIVHLIGVIGDLKDAETGQRGFLLTGVESYLEPYNNSRAKLDKHFKNLNNFIKI